MQTIRIPKNLLFLSDKLPQPNYERAKIAISSDLPDIRRKNTKKREHLQENLLDNSIEGNIINNNPQIASIVKKKNNREISSLDGNINNLQLIKNSDEEVIPIKLIEKREKSPSGYIIFFF